MDWTALDTYLPAHVPGFRAPSRATVLKGGTSNPTIRLDCADGTAFALRMRPPGGGQWAHAIDREYRVLSALRDSPVPVPRVHHYCADESIIGGPFYVMDFVEGRIIEDNALAEMPREDRRAAWESLARTFARLHSIDWRAAGLEGFGKEGGFLRRQLRRHTQTYRDWNAEPLPDLDWLINWLEIHLPEQDGPLAIVHADIRTGNVIYAPDRPEVVAVLDWELSTIGDAWADAALLLLPFYADLGPIGNLVDIDLDAHGLPSAADVLGWYCDELGSPPPDNLDLLLVFDLFRYSSVNYGVGMRGATGISPSPLAAAFGAAAGPIATRARHLIESGALKL